MRTESMDKKFKIEYQRINTRDLIPHPIAQREFVKSHGDKLAKQFKWDLYDPVRVSFRDGKYWVIDGQHRLYAIRRNAGGKDVVVLCRVFYGMTELDEAEYFLHKGVIVKDLTVGDNYAVAYKIGDEKVTGMVRGAETAGWTVDFKTKKSRDRITALKALMTCYEALTYEQYVGALRALKAAWGSDIDAVSGMILKGMSLFYKTYWGRFEPKDLVTRLNRISPTVILRDGQALKTSIYGNGKNLRQGVPYARAILNQYNVKRTTKRLEDEL